MCRSVPYRGWMRVIACAMFAGLPLNAAQSPSLPDPTLQPHHSRYVIQRQDVLTLSFPLSPELNQTVTVQLDGYVDLQSTGSVYAEGLTSPQLALELKKAYAGILHDPIINVDVTDFHKPFFTVSGQVGKPGQYELREELTVAEGVAVAGGMGPTAKQQVFLLRRTAEGTRYQVTRVDLGKMLNGRSVKEIAVLQPGDILYVPEKYIANFRKYLPYSANVGTYINPGIF